MVDIDKIKEYLEESVYDYYNHETLERYWCKIKVFVTTTQKVLCEDWKTAIAQGKPAIPPNTKLQIENVTTNYYGVFLEAIYNDFHYYINPNYVDKLEIEKYKCSVKTNGGEIKVEKK